MKLNITKEQLVGIGKFGLKLGKGIVIEGMKAVAIKGAAAVITTSIDEGFKGVKDITLDDVLSGKRKRSKGIDSEKSNEVVTDIIEEVVELETM